MPEKVYRLVLKLGTGCFAQPRKTYTTVNMFLEDLYTFQTGLHKVEITGLSINLKYCEQLFNVFYSLTNANI